MANRLGKIGEDRLFFEASQSLQYFGKPFFAAGLPVPRVDNQLVPALPCVRGLRTLGYLREVL